MQIEKPTNGRRRSKPLANFTRDVGLTRDATAPLLSRVKFASGLLRRLPFVGFSICINLHLR